MNGTNVSSSDSASADCSSWVGAGADARGAEGGALRAGKPQRGRHFDRARDRRGGAVKPNTLVRMARQVGFEGYEDFREPFREAIRRGTVSFPDRARWLQDSARAAIWAGFMPTWSGRRSAQHRGDLRRHRRRALKARPRRSGPRATGLYAGGRRQQRQRPQLHLPRLHRHGAVPRHPAPRLDAG
jgi:hypothetical protein